MEWPATLNELAKGMNAPRVVVDNAALPSATLVEVDSTSNRHRHLLAAVQTLTDLGLDIKKAYVSSDGPWFMGFFHVSDQRGLKLADPNFVRSICAAAAATASDDDDGGGVDPNLAGLTTLELTGSDRPGILSEVFAVLRDLDCNVVEAKAWTHNGRIACLIFVKDHNSGGRIEEDPGRVRAIDTRLRNVLSGETKTAVAPPRVTHSDRRLHQLMFADPNYERSAGETSSSLPETSISIQKCVEREYSIVSIHCSNRPKLPFDVVCTLTDMDYVVFHGTMDISGDRAYQEFYIRHADGNAIRSEGERQRVIQCLQAAIERRASKQGLRLELRAPDRKGLLADVTRTFRENGLSITRAEATTIDGMAMDVFYVTDTSGRLPDRAIIDAVIDGIGSQSIKLLSDKDQPWRSRQKPLPPSTIGGGRRVALGLFSLGTLAMRNLYSLGLIGSSWIMP